MEFPSTAEREAITQLAGILRLAHCGTPRLTAGRLLNEFQTIGAILAASRERLLQVSGNDQDAVVTIMTFRAAMLYSLRSDVAVKPVLASWEALLDYLHADMGQRGTERVRVLHLNTRNMLIRDEVISEGSIDEAALYVREVLRRSLELGSAAIILAHNHPSGDATPSRADIDITRKVAEAGKRLGISLHDHVIISANGHSSLRSMGLL